MKPTNIHLVATIAFSFIILNTLIAQAAESTVCDSVGGGGINNIMNIGYSYGFCGSDTAPTNLTFRFKVGSQTALNPPLKVDIGDFEVRSIDSATSPIARLLFLKKIDSDKLQLDFFIQFEDVDSATTKIYYCKNQPVVEVSAATAGCDKEEKILDLRDFYFKVTKMPFHHGDYKPTLIELLKLVQAKLAAH